MKLIIGIGNPGAKYANNRHNAGHIVVDELKMTAGPAPGFPPRKPTKGDPFLEALLAGSPAIYKTNVFMNDSGKAVKKIMENGKWKLENLYIVHDDLDIPLGQFKIQYEKGPKDHNGLNSVEEELKSKDFWRIRIGIENRDKENRISGEVYTLQDFEPAEREIIDKVAREIAARLRELQ